MARRHGFTLIEVIVVMVVLGIAAAAAVAYLSSATATTALAGATQSLASDLSFAQNRAIATHQKTYVVFTPGSGTNPDKYELQQPLGTTLSRPIHDSGTVTMGKSQSRQPGAKLGLASSLTIGFDASGQPFTVSSTGVESYLTKPEKIRLRSASQDLDATISVSPFTGEVLAAMEKK